MRTIIYLLIILFIPCFITANESPPTEEFKLFLKEYYSSKEKAYGVPKLQYALLKGYRGAAIKLLESGENPNNFGNAAQFLTPLLIAIKNEDEELVDLMLKSNVDVNFRGWVEYNPKVSLLTSPITLAVQKNSKANIVRMLANNNLIIDDSPNGGISAIMWCISRGEEEKFFGIIENIQSSFDINYISKDFTNLFNSNIQPPTSTAQKNNYLHIYQYLIDHGVAFETQRNSCLNSPISTGNIDLVKLLISFGANIDFRPPRDFDYLQAPIFAAINFSGYYANFDKKLLDNIPKPNDSLELLVELGAVINFSSATYRINSNPTSAIAEQSGQTPLGYAMYIKANSAAEILLANAADIEFIDEFGSTPLIRAIQKNNIDGVKLLINAGVNIKNTGNGHKTPTELALALGASEIFSLLIEVEANSYL